MVSRRWAVLVVPLLAAVAVVVRRVDRVQTGPDAGVFLGLVRNLRASGSLTSPTDQYWIRLSPADTVARLGHVPVPDLGPLYPLSVAIVPAPLAVAFLIVHVVALTVAVLAIGFLAERATGSVGAAVAAQVIALWGPFRPDLFFRQGRPLDLFGMLGSDGPAVAWWLAGFAVLTGAVAWRRLGPRSTAVVAAALLAAAVLTRYAVAGAVVGLLAGLVWARARGGRDERRWQPVAAALVVAAAWQVVVYPLLIDGSGPKGIATHRGDIGPIGTTIAGWFGFAVGSTTAAAVAIVAGLLVVLVVVAVVAEPGGIVALSAASAAGLVVLLVVARQLLDAGLNLREERHVLLLRFLLSVMAVCGVRDLARAVSSRASAATGRAIVGAAAPVLAVVSIVAAGGWPGPRQLLDEEPPIAVGPWLAEHGDPPVMSNNSEDWYVRTGVPAADLPRSIEATTFATRDIGRELADLGRDVGTVVQAYRGGFFDSVDLRDVPCASIGDVWTAPDDVLGGFELAVVDLTGCV